MDTKSNRTVALKVLHAYYSQEDDIIREFFQELERVAAAPHPNILAPLAWGKDDERVWIASELQPQGNLRSNWQFPGSLSSMVHITEEIAAALEHSIALGFTHRNIKPTNIFWNRITGSVLLGDFGSALLGERAHPLLRTALTTPMPAYMAPEYISDGEGTAKSETFSLAVLDYWMLTGSVPYISEAPSTMYAKAMRYQLAKPSEVNPHVSREMDDIIVHALAPFPYVRPAGPAAFAATLRTVTPRQAEPAEEDVPDLAVREVVPVEVTETIYERLWKAPVPRNVVRERLVYGGIALLFVVASFLGYKALTYSAPVPTASTTLSADIAPNRWVLPRYDALNTGFVPLSTANIRGEVKWTFKTEAPFQASPASDETTVYAATGDNRLLALDIETGATRWQVQTTGPVDAAPTTAGDLVYVGLRDKRIIAVDKNTGTQRWEFMTNNPVVAGGVADRGVLFQGSTDGRLYALDAATGRLLWDFDTASSINAPPTVLDDAVIIASRDGWVHFIDRASGKPRFIFYTGGAQYGAPAVHDNRVFIPSESRTLFALDINERSSFMDRQIYWAQVQLWVFQMAPQPEPPKGFVWAARLPARAATGPAVAHGKVYVGSEASKVLAFEEATGKKVWEFSTGKQVYSSPVVTRDALYTADDAGDVFALNPETGEQQWVLPTGGRIRTDMVIAKNTLLVTSEDGTLYAIR